MDAGRLHLVCKDYALAKVLRIPMDILGKVDYVALDLKANVAEKTLNKN